MRELLIQECLPIGFDASSLYYTPSLVIEHFLLLASQEFSMNIPEAVSNINVSVDIIIR